MKASVKVMFTQMHANKGIDLFGESYIEEMIKEFKQLDEGEMTGNNVAIPLNPYKLTNAEISQALESVNLTKEKRNEIIKERSCANGSDQERYFKYG